MSWRYPPFWCPPLATNLLSGHLSLREVLLEACQAFRLPLVPPICIPEYAPQFVSTPGKRDGLYWQTKADEPLSPLGPLLAAATREGYTNSVSCPWK